MVVKLGEIQRVEVEGSRMVVGGIRMGVKLVVKVVVGRRVEVKVGGGRSPKMKMIIRLHYCLVFIHKTCLF